MIMMKKMMMVTNDVDALQTTRAPSLENCFVFGETQSLVLPLFVQGRVSNS